MGPLAVRTEYQGAGTGKEIVTRGVEWLKARGASVIGLETMPRTMDNIGFYSRLGFLPGRLTITTTLEAAYGDLPAALIGRLSPTARDDVLGQCRELVQRMLPGYDYTREIMLTHELSLGDTVLLYDGDTLIGFALAHTAPLVEGRAREELRVLKLVLADESRFVDLVRAIRKLDAGRLPILIFRHRSVGCSTSRGLHVTQTGVTLICVYAHPRKPLRLRRDRRRAVLRRPHHRTAAAGPRSG